MKNFIWIAFVCTLCPLYSQPFTRDTTFVLTYPFHYFYDYTQLGTVSDLYEEPDGSIMIAGAFMEWPQTKRTNVIRLTEKGTLDLSWNPSLWITKDAGYIKKANGYYYFNSGFSGIRKTDYYGNFQNNGLGHIPLDTSFAGSPTNPYIFPDGSMITGGDGGKYPSANNFQRRLYFMRIRPDGYVDSSFHHNTDFDVEKTMRYDSTRLLLYGGWVTHYDSVPVNKLCRIDTAGNLDTTFYSGIFFSGGPQPKYIQPDGKIIVGERFMIHNHPDTLGLIRLNPDGSLDSTFNNFNSINGQSSVTTVCPTTDGGFLIGGFFTSYQGYPRNRIVKTDANGFIDLKHFNGEGIDSSKNWINYPASVRNIIPAQNDKYYVMGHFLKYDGQVVRPLIRILGLSHTVGVEAATPSQVRVYPNPAAGDVRVEWELPPGSRNAEIRVRDMQGREVARQTVTKQEGQWLWDTREVPDGIYLYELRTEAQEVRAQGKIVVKK